MQTPLVRGSSYILNIPDVSDLLQNPGNEYTTNRINAWGMMQIAVRRTLRPAFCEQDISVQALRSRWTAKEWVQFLPAVDSFIPKSWREKVKLKGKLFVKFKPDGSLNFEGNENEFPVFDSNFEEYMKRFLVVTKTVYDLGGQPCEAYVATIECTKAEKSNTFFFTLNHADDKDNPFNGVTEGHLRMMMVRIDNPHRNQPKGKTDVWSMLFGENKSSRMNMNSIQNDPMAALPLVSERIPYTTIN